MQKYRADFSQEQKDGAVIWNASWLGGPTLSKIENCRWDSLAGDVRITAYATGEADTAFSIPAMCSYLGCRVRGYFTGDDDGNTVFRHTYY